MVKVEKNKNKGAKVFFEGEEMEIVGDIGSVLLAFNNEYGIEKLERLMTSVLNKIERDLNKQNKGINVHIIEIK